MDTPGRVETRRRAGKPPLAATAIGFHGNAEGIFGVRRGVRAKVPRREKRVMGVKQYKPTSPGRRFQTVSDFAEITTDKPEKSLLAPKPNKAGRNNNGRITIAPSAAAATSVKLPHHRLQAQQGSACPPRLLHHRVRPEPQRATSRFCTMWTARSATSWHPKGLRVGDMVMSGPEADIQAGQRPAASPVHPRRHRSMHAVEAAAGQGRGHRWCVRPAPASQLMGKEGNVRPDPAHAVFGNVRRVLHHLPRHRRSKWAMSEHSNIKIGKAGRNRWTWACRPTVRGTVMNPIDHPHGGGEGQEQVRRSPIR